MSKINHTRFLPGRVDTSCASPLEPLYKAYPVYLSGKVKQIYVPSKDMIKQEWLKLRKYDKEALFYASTKGGYHFVCKYRGKEAVIRDWGSAQQYVIGLLRNKGLL